MGLDGRAFGGDANTWYRLQAAYDLAQAMKRADQIKVGRITTVAWRYVVPEWTQGMRGARGTVLRPFRYEVSI